MHVTEERKKIYNAIIVLLSCSYSLSLFSFCLPHSSIILRILMLTGKASAALAHQLDSLLIGSLKVHPATYGRKMKVIWECLIFFATVISLPSNSVCLKVFKRKMFI
jgi:hypothetical protein